MPFLKCNIVNNKLLHSKGLEARVAFCNCQQQRLRSAGCASARVPEDLAALMTSAVSAAYPEVLPGSARPGANTKETNCK
jgi:hypothetical protein